MAWYGTVWHGMAWYGMVWHGMAWYDMVWHGMAWYVMWKWGVVEIILVTFSTFLILEKSFLESFKETGRKKE